MGGAHAGMQQGRVLHKTPPYRARGHHELPGMQSPGLPDLLLARLHTEGLQVHTPHNRLSRRSSHLPASFCDTDRSVGADDAAEAPMRDPSTLRLPASTRPWTTPLSAI